MIAICLPLRVTSGWPARAWPEIKLTDARIPSFSANTRSNGRHSIYLSSLSRNGQFPDEEVRAGRNSVFFKWNRAHPGSLPGLR